MFQRVFSLTKLALSQAFSKNNKKLMPCSFSCSIIFPFKRTLYLTCPRIHGHIVEAP